MIGGEGADPVTGAPLLVVPHAYSPECGTGIFFHSLSSLSFEILEDNVKQNGAWIDGDYLNNVWPSSPNNRK